MDVVKVRAEIKAWEREHRETHGRDPTIQEIKDRPEIAAKYKLYKQLSKRPDASASASTSSKPRRRTPPSQDRHRPAVSSILSASKHRAVKTEAPLLTSNPFSPVKNRGKTRDKQSLSADSVRSPIPLLLPSDTRQTNPFLTPSKSRPAASPRKILSSQLEDDPFPLIDAQLRASSSKAPSRVSFGKVGGMDKERRTASRSSYDEHHLFDEAAAKGSRPEDAITRARKRLRGEHVSPSPVKEKRARTVMERILSSGLERGSLFSALQNAQDENSDEEPVRRGTDGFDDEVITATPAKPVKDGKMFVKLFDEAIPAPPFTHVKPGASQGRSATTQVTSSGQGLFSFGFAPRGKPEKQRAVSPPSGDSEDDMEIDPLQSAEPEPSKFKGVGSKLGQMGNLGKSNTVARAVIPGRDDLFESTSNRTVAEAKADKAAVKKRALSVSEAGEVMNADMPGPSCRTNTPLLPPSPPPPSVNGSKYTGDKGKAMAKGLARKKTKLLEQLEGDDESSGHDSADDGEIKVKEIPWSWDTHLRANRHDNTEGSELADDLLADSGPEFDMTVYRSAPLPSTAVDVPKEQGQFEVNLPEHLRRVLALSPEKSAPYHNDAEKLARGLIYGRREGHYDPSRGGEIWGVGEAGEGDEEVEFTVGRLGTNHQNDHGEDDDWEGEPVPWEVGEL